MENRPSSDGTGSKEGGSPGECELEPTLKLPVKSYEDELVGKWEEGLSPVNIFILEI